MPRATGPIARHSVVASESEFFDDTRVKVPDSRCSPVPDSDLQPGLVSPPTADHLRPPTILVHDRSESSAALRADADFDFVRPFDQAHPAGLEVLGHAEVEELVWPIQPIGVEVEDRQPGRVFVDERERRARDRRRVGDAETLGDGSRKVRLPGPERADQGDDGVREQQPAEPAAEGFGRSEIGENYAASARGTVTIIWSS